MRYRKLIYLLLLFVPLALYSCVKEPIDGDKSDEEQTTIPYTVTVTDGTGTKATVEGNYGSFHYVFEEGDALFVTDCDALHVPGSTNDPDDATIYGVLTLVSGAGETTGTFSGDLICVGGAKPENDTQLYATLVSQKDVIHEHAKGKITGIISDTETQKGWCSVDAVDATAYEDAVSRYSNFQGSALYSDERFTLSQSSVFLVFNLYFSSSDSGSKTISVYDGSTVVRSKELTLPATGTKQLSFIAAFPDASAFSGDASVYVDGVAYPFDATLLTANYFYNVARTVGFDGLTIKATQTGTTTITYNLSKTIQYNLNGSGWQNLNNTINSGNISLNQNDVVFFRGNSSNNNYPQPSGSPVMAFDQDCDVFGDMMSLLCSVSGDEYTIQHSLNNKTNVFKGFFAGNTHINIPADKDLLLPATTLTTSCYEAMFSGCTGLTKAPVLGSPTTLAASCYKQMFKDSGLTTAPSGIMDPNVTTIPASACYLMFKDCKALTTGPSSIAATSLGTNACQEMFSGCDHLTTALASTTLGGATFDTNACFQMFKGCSALTTGPSSIVATSFGAHACEEMFSGCTSLTTALSSLAASSSVGDYGFRKMFYGCSALTTGPSSIVATSFGAHACYQMFYHCGSMDCSSMTISASSAGDYACQGMFYEAALTKAPSISISTLGEKTCYQMFKGCTSLTTGPATLSATTFGLSSCEEMFMGCTLLSSVAASLGGDGVVLPEKVFKKMFSGCGTSATTPAVTGPTSITAASADVSACEEMFSGSGLTTAPPISISTLGEKTCYRMFKGCTSLTTGPATLSATTFGLSSCEEMFMGCTLLSSVAASLGGDGVVLPEKVFKNMFSGCGTLATAPVTGPTSITAASADVSACEGMFSNSGLTAAPTITVGSLGTKSFYQMFYNSTHLATVPSMTVTSLAADSSENCSEMFYGCSSLNGLNYISLLETTLTESCYNSMFQGCSSISTIPNRFLPAGGSAGSLAAGCYRQMFMGCSLLSSVPSDLLPASVLANGCYANMFRGCEKLEVAPLLNATTPKPGCYFGMFRFCYVLKELKCALSPSGFDNFITTQGSCTASNTTYPSTSDMKNWTENNMWSVFNKWLDQSGKDKTPRGLFYCLSTMQSKFPTNTNTPGAVPTNWWDFQSL